MAFDAALEKVIVFGGCDATHEFGDTWEYDGKRWRQAATAGPSPRTGARMAFDASRERVVLFGGAAGNQMCGDTWTWDGSTWTKLEVPSPPARSHHAMSWDSRRQKVLLFGGYDHSRGVNLDDAWELEETGWRERKADAKLPDPRSPDPRPPKKGSP